MWLVYKLLNKYEKYDHPQIGMLIIGWYLRAKMYNNKIYLYFN